MTNDWRTIEEEDRRGNEIFLLEADPILSVVQVKILADPVHRAH